MLKHNSLEVCYLKRFKKTLRKERKRKDLEKNFFSPSKLGKFLFKIFGSFSKLKNETTVLQREDEIEHIFLFQIRLYHEFSRIYGKLA